MYVSSPRNIKFSHNFYSLPAENFVINSYLKMSNSKTCKGCHRKCLS